MTVELTLRATDASGLLLPARLAQGLALLAKLAPVDGDAPAGAMRGHELRLARRLSLDDDACAGFVLDFAAQGGRVRGTAHGPSEALLVWAFHALAGALRCTLGGDDGRALVPSPEEYRGGAVAYVDGYEARVAASRARKGEGAEDGRALLEWLAHEEHVALADGADALGEALPLDDAEALYETLLESDAVDDVFVSERELGRLLARFRAWRRGGA